MRKYRQSLAIGVLALVPLASLSLTTEATSVPLYHLGSQGRQVAIFQQELQDLGYHPGGISGQYTKATKKAVQIYQKGHRLATDGIIGPLTEHALNLTLPQVFTPVFGDFGEKTLRFLDYGAPVVSLQNDLARLDLYHGAPDGVFNNFTVEAVKTFKVRHGFAANAVVYPVVARAIINALKAKPAASKTLPKAPPTKPTPGASSVAPKSIPLVLGYYVPGAAAWQDLLNHRSQINAIAPFWYSFRPNDSLNNFGPNEAFLTSWSHAHHIQVYPMVINGYGNDHMLQSPTLLNRDVSTLLQVAKRNNYDGFNVDFESLNNDDEVGLDNFVAKLAKGLHQEGKKLIVSVGPRTSERNNYHVYNYRSLGASADYVDLMLYDAHDNGGSAGPVAPLSWTQNITHYAEETIPSRKILVGLAGYGYNWASTGSTELTDDQALSLASRYGSTWVGGNVEEPKITYRVDGVTHTVWFEDSASEVYKVRWVGQARLGGVALWDLGEENAGVWPMLKQNL